MSEATEGKLDQSVEQETGLTAQIPSMPARPSKQDDPARFTKRRSRKKKLLLAGVLVVAVAAGAWYLLGRTPPVVPTESAALAKTDLKSEISLTGTVESADSVQVYSSLSAFVQQVNVKVGDRVEAGDVLAQLDTSDLELTIAQQQAELSKAQRTAALSKEMSEKNLANAQGDVAQGLDSSLLAAENALRSAQQNLNDARRDMNDHKDDMDHADEVINSLEKKKTRAYDAWKKAVKDKEDPAKIEELETAYEAALSEYNKAYDEYGGDLNSYSREYRSARVAYENALANYEAAKNSSSQNLDSLEDRLKSAEIEGDLTSSQLALKKYQKDLADSTVKAPISGTVTAVFAKLGAPGTGLLFVVENTDQLVIKTKLKEYDVASVTVGMPVEVKSDATGEEVFMGTVTRISPTASKAADGSTQTSGSVEFETEVTLDDHDAALRVGMNVRLNVVTAEKSGVWAVPFDAVTADAQGEPAVYVARPNEEGVPIAVAVPVTTGLETDFYIEITSDELKDGDIILTAPASVALGEPVTLAEGMSQTLQGEAPAGAVAEG